MPGLYWDKIIFKPLRKNILYALVPNKKSLQTELLILEWIELVITMRFRNKPVKEVINSYVEILSH